MLLISRPSLTGALQWTLPKGLVEAGERPEEAALREVIEETGVRAEIVEPLPTIDYWFVDKTEGVRYHKFVHYFLMRSLGGSTDEHDEEVVEARWVPFPQAEKMLAFDNERALVRLTEKRAT